MHIDIIGFLVITICLWLVCNLLGLGLFGSILLMILAFMVFNYWGEDRFLKLILLWRLRLRLILVRLIIFILAVFSYWYRIRKRWKLFRISQVFRS